MFKSPFEKINHKLNHQNILDQTNSTFFLSNTAGILTYFFVSPWHPRSHRRNKKRIRANENIKEKKALETVVILEYEGFSYKRDPLYTKKIIICSLFILLMLNGAYADLTLHGVEEVLNNMLQDKNNCRMQININGPLNPIRGYISTLAGYTHNKRFFSENIKTSYALLKDTATEERSRKIFQRDYERDEPAAWPLNTSDHTNYIYNYHQAFLIMFSSSDGTIDVNSSGIDSFSGFLQSSKVRTHKYKILASLLLLSEGIDVFMEITKSHPKSTRKLVLKENKTKGNHFSLSLTTNFVITGRNNSTSFPALQNNTIFLIEFFLKYRNHPVQEEYAEPRNLEEFRTGRFLNNLRWLIQTYIYNYFSTSEEVNIFNQTVHDILLEYLPEYNESKGKEDISVQVFRKCFTTIGNNTVSCINREYSGRIMRIFKAHETLHVEMCPGTIYPLIFTKNSIISTEDQEVPLSITDTFACTMEEVLLGLLSCFFYDAKKNTYTTEHIPDASYKLFSFFISHKTPSEMISSEITSKWSLVLAELQNRNILYEKDNRSRLVTGIMNLLYVITEITGIYPRESKVLHYYATFVKNACEKAVLTGIQEKLGLYLEYLFLLLFNNSEDLSCKLRMKRDKIKVTLSHLEIIEIDERKDLIGILHIKYKDRMNPIEIRINLMKNNQVEVSYNYNRPVISPAAEKMIFQLKGMVKIKSIPDTFTECMIAHFITEEIDTLSGKKVNLEYFQDIPKIEDRTPLGMDRFLLLGKISTLKQKEHPVLLIISILDTEFQKTSNPAIMQFLANIITSELKERRNISTKIISILLLINETTGINIIPEITE
ncbi:hypothetical protein NEAUS04_1988 [Nematocida ausubeli]|nr:hypothetical protein NEAUS07_2119 [Nematocida ausubeli]KAI5150415.1 hypothetical protein NEAUS05_2161 [Nematocida ausubeli]KAI5164153.1 hypothetical protein NEAUS04_1988 [Nematocida ausubeli]